MGHHGESTTNTQSRKEKETTHLVFLVVVKNRGCSRGPVARTPNPLFWKKIAVIVTSSLLNVARPICFCLHPPCTKHFFFHEIYKETHFQIPFNITEPSQRRSKKEGPLPG